MEHKKAQEETVCIRITPSELSQLETDARERGLSRDDYIRHCLVRKHAAGSAGEELSQMVDLLRMLQVALSSDMRALTHYLDLLEKKGPDGFADEDLMDVIRFEITRMPELTELLFSAEREVTSLVCRLSEQAGLD